MLSAYLDTVLIIGLAERDLEPVEMAALADLLERRKLGEITLCTSHVAKEELARHALSGHNAGELIYMLLEDVPAVEEEYVSTTLLGSLLIGANSGPIVKDEILGKMAQIGLTEDDARHIFQATKNGVDYFVTCDVPMLRRRTAVEEVTSIKLRRPSQLAFELAAAPS